MASTIITKYGSGAPLASDLVRGELAVDTENKRLYTENSGGSVVELGTNPAADVTFGDNVKAVFGASSDLQIYHDAFDSIINDNGTGSLKLQQGGSTKLEVTSQGVAVTGTAITDGVTVTGNILLQTEGNELQFNTSSTPVNKIYSDDTYTSNGLTISADNGVVLQSTNNYLLLDDTGTNEMVLNVDGGERMRVTSIGIDVTGTVTASGTINMGNNVALNMRNAADTANYRALRLNTSNNLELHDGKVVIQSAGNVGIGTTSPSDLLDISANGTSAMRLSDSSSPATYAQFTQANGVLTFAADAGNAQTGSNMQFEVDGTERMRIDSDGNVSVKTGTFTVGQTQLPTIILDDSDGTGNRVIDFQAIGVTQNQIASVGSGNLAFSAGGDIASNEAMRIDSSGNVGIGTSSPSELLEVSSATGVTSVDPTVIRISTTSSGSWDSDATWGALQFYNADGSDGGAKVQAQIAANTGSSSGGVSDIVFSSAAATTGTLTERMRIDYAGKVGIGTDTPDVILHLATDSTDYPVLRFERNDTGVSAGNRIGRIEFEHQDTDDPGTAAIIEAVSEGGAGPVGIRFETGTPTSRTERMRIDSGGRLLINTTSETTPSGNNTAYLVVESDSTANSEGVYIRGDGGISDLPFVVGDAVNNAELQIYGDGDVENTNGTYGTLSDARVKENITDAGSQWEDLKALRVRKYNLIRKPDESHIGVVAQELEEAGMAGLVKEVRRDGMKSVKTSILYMKAIKALQEAMDRIETLEAKVAQLEGAN